MDFLSVGSNDLVQFLFAADRGNRRVAERFDPLSAPILRALMHIVDRARAGGKPVTLCGELASKPIGALALVGLGYRALSLAPSALGAVKAMLLDLDAKKVEALLRPLVETPTPGRFHPRAAGGLRRGRRTVAVTTLPETKLDTLLTRHAAVEAELSRQLPPETFVKLSREFAEIDPVVGKIKAYRSVAAEIADLEALIADPKTEAAMREMADDERRTLEAKRERLCRGAARGAAAQGRDGRAQRDRRNPRRHRRRRGRRCSPATCSACTSATPRGKAGRRR